MKILIPFIILNFAGVYFLYKFNIDKIISYNILLFASLCMIYAGSLFNLLKPVTFLVFSILIIMAIKGLSVIIKGQCKNTEGDIYLILNGVTSIIFAIIFSVQKPMLYYWDEIKLWGPSAKAVKYFDRLCTVGINPTHMDRNYPVGNSILNYFFSFFSKDFSEEILLLSYAFLYFAAFSASAYLIYKWTRSHSIGVISYFVFLLLPFIVSFHSYSSDYSNILYAYGTSMVDFNLSIVFLIAIVVYLYKPESYWFLFPLGFLVTIKKSGIFFAILAFCIISCFELFGFRGKNWKFKKALKTIAIALIVPIIVYLSWNTHVNSTYEFPTDSGYNLTGEVLTEDYAYTDYIEEELPPLLSIFNSSLRSERHAEILDEMKDYFLTNREVIFIKDIHLIMLLFILGLLASIYSEKQYRLPVFFINLGITLGCGVYNLIISYQMQFYNDKMVEYPRYMLSYYLGWICVILLLFCISIGINPIIKKCLLTFILILTVGYIYDTGLDLTIISTPDNVYYDRIRVTENCEESKKILKENDRVYLVRPEGDDITLLNYSYSLMPAYVNIDTFNTGINFTRDFKSDKNNLNENLEYNIADKETFTELMRNYFDYVYVTEAGDDFIGSYSDLFENGISDYTLYRITNEEIPMQVATI